jgi:hypothetical protein
MAFERTAQALLKQFVQRSLGCTFGLLGFSFPKHKSLLLDGNHETQVRLDHLPEPSYQVVFKTGGILLDPESST